jgi:hypothetical protein
MSQNEKRPLGVVVQTTYAKVARFVDHYKVPALGGLALVALVAGIVGQFVPRVQNFLTAKDVVAYLTLLVVIDFAITDRRRQEENSVSFAENQDESLPILIQAVEAAKNQPVDLLEYAGQTTLPLIRCVQKAGCPVRILMKHPDTVAGLQSVTTS